MTDLKLRRRRNRVALLDNLTSDVGGVRRLVCLVGSTGTFLQLIRNEPSIAVHVKLLH